MRSNQLTVFSNALSKGISLPDDSKKLLSLEINEADIVVSEFFFSSKSSKAPSAFLSATAKDRPFGKLTRCCRKHNSVHTTSY